MDLVNDCQNNFEHDIKASDVLVGKKTKCSLVIYTLLEFNLNCISIIEFVNVFPNRVLEKN